MRILIVGVERIKKDERYMDDKGWSFQKAFEKLGLKTESFFYRKKGNFEFLEKNKHLKDLWRFYMNKRLIDHVKNSKPDILLILKGETIYPDTLWKIRRKTNVFLVNVFPDNPLYMGKFEAIEPYHYFFVKDSYILTVLRGVGLKNTHYLPQCSDPDIHRPFVLDENDKKKYCSNLSLIGSMYPYRLKLIQQLIGFKPAIWGRGWSKISDKEIIKLYRGKDIRGTQKVKAINGTAISLNPHHPLNDINGVNRRTFDIAACKGFQLADLKKDMEKVFKPNQEIICYRTIDELRRLIEYYLSHPDERVQIAEASYKRFLMEHTYYHRAKEILEIVQNNKIMI